MRQVLVRQLRRVTRFASLLAIAAGGLWSYFKLRRRGEPSRQARAEWLHEICRRGLGAMRVQLATTGQAPADGLIVSNHLSYLDILVLSASVPCAFIAKSEIARWPIIGRFARWAGCVFVQRHKKGDAAAKSMAVIEALTSGVPIVLFPEGRTTDGHSVLRFHSTMLQPAIEVGARVTPCALAYETDDGSLAREVPYWGNMVLLPHIIRLLGTRKLRARVAFGEPRMAIGDRKQLARDLHEQVQQLYNGLHPGGLTVNTPKHNTAEVIS